MENYFNLFFGSLILSISEVYVWSKFYNERIKYKSILLYISIIVLALSGVINSLYVNGFFRIIISTSFMLLCNWIIFRKKINDLVVITIYGQIILTFADIFFTLFWIIFFGKDALFVRNNFFSTFFPNLFVSIIYVVISNIKFFKSFYLKVLKLTEKVNFKKIILFCLLLVFSINFLMAVVYYDINSRYVFLINSLLLVVYSFIVYRTLSEKNINMVVTAENKSLMESLHQYEDMVDRQRVDNHENKNQLLIIKNMIKKNDQDVIKYIDTVVKDEKEDDEALYTKVKSIPSGGLQGIIYQKMLSMKDNRILFSLDVSRDVRHIELEKMNMEDNYKLCKIVGVLLDNAIEESLKIEDRRIMISLYVDDDMLIIDISNRFDGKIDLDKIDEEGYTTKGDGHGYGLSLVKKLVSESDCFINERKVNKDVFKQIIKFKLK